MAGLCAAQASGIKNGEGMGDSRAISLVLGLSVCGQRQKVLQAMVPMGDPLTGGAGEESGANAQVPFGSDTELVSA